MRLMILSMPVIALAVVVAFSSVKAGSDNSTSLSPSPEFTKTYEEAMLASQVKKDALKRNRHGNHISYEPHSSPLRH